MYFKNDLKPRTLSALVVQCTSRPLLTIKKMGSVIKQ